MAERSEAASSGVFEHRVHAPSGPPSRSRSSTICPRSITPWSGWPSSAATGGTCREHTLLDRWSKGDRAGGIARPQAAEALHLQATLAAGTTWEHLADSGERDRPARRGKWPYAGGLQALITPPGAAPEPEVAGSNPPARAWRFPAGAVVRRLRRLVRDVVERAGRAKRSASRTRVRCCRPRASRCRWSGSGRGRGPRGAR